jgi:2-amino-4-hydroxy-6-hydroxymethyldihydropteridine diphosphokinase
LGDRLHWLQTGLNAIKKLPNTSIVAVSNVYETAFVGESTTYPQADYLNAACQLATSLPASQLLAELLTIEQACGRKRIDGKHNEPRTLDLDLLAYGELVLATSTLVLPHPRLQERLFVLEPLLGLPAATSWVHPVFGETVVTLHQRLATTIGTNQPITSYSESLFI